MRGCAFPAAQTDVVSLPTRHAFAILTALLASAFLTAITAIAAVAVAAVLPAYTAGCFRATVGTVVSRVTVIRHRATCGPAGARRLLAGRRDDGRSKQGKNDCEET